ncbi:hypothetical protein [Haloarcula salinisoli]|uniref:DUF6788 domain-containing protein n=1 Tax=Haloarcula salinisoli TaxID=2487746 RepID=A0A8J7YML6_9EURY|nr:hypothetical protein [Halomicroarcula salinisoli]MBX0288611.1 hypothetical protein [Halomicroarcula salinisoli]MBX0306009.1 hypothetical protein [Halomicroarcula salinisoli]
MGDRDHAIEALEHLRAIQAAESDKSVIKQHRRDAIQHVETLVAELERSTREESSAEAVERPDDWDDDEEWEDKLESAREKAGISASKGTLTTKTINGREYYYLQWRDGDKVKSQYVAPVDPA